MLALPFALPENRENGDQQNGSVALPQGCARRDKRNSVSQAEPITAE
jgi:hypothetical protein